MTIRRQASPSGEGQEDVRLLGRSLDPGESLHGAGKDPTEMGGVVRGASLTVSDSYPFERW